MSTAWRRWNWLLPVLCLLLAGFARGADSLESVHVKGVPHVRQKPDFCGEACAEMFLRKLGRPLTQDDVFNYSGLDPVSGRGCYTRELTTALTRIGFETGPVYHTVAANRADTQLERLFRALHTDLKNGIPSIICMRYDERPKTTEHFRLVLGYDARSDEVLYHEPAVNGGADRRMKRERLLNLWPLKYSTSEWTVIRLRLEPKRLTTEKPARGGFTNADFAQHVMKLKKKLPGDDFHVVIQSPFVVVGDEAAETVKRRSVRTIKWAVDLLKQDYFEKDPDRILDIWLFKNRQSYETHVKGVFGERPTTPYGYYSSQHGALIMNIATGGGTLVHEIVHPFMAANFPGCPSWFNEGLASLYEQCGEKQGHIYGHTNWRLAGLQQALRKKSVPSFQTLTGTTTNQFYREDTGSNYGQARYLCYYLQERQLLRKFYREFRHGVKDDPSGYATLRKVLGQPDMKTFRKEWEAFALALRR